MNGGHDDRMRILEMLEKGKIKADEAAKLLDALSPEGERGGEAPESEMLHIRVTEDGEQKVNINVPIALAKLAARFIPEHAKEKMSEKDIDVDRLVTLIQTGARGKIVEVHDGGNCVDVTIE
jgi:hypothetical protein